ncbi:hypothetical protein LX73_2309 [Fodinibius salinus]|uniref:Uncharacterized protein n=1 Tax=Fodinibius salinus TaxID=860790 RepID=A0A5D3YGD0_9BACT|nr:hypothetical protein LX73_2309 [Fodinibius salinus]
MAVKLPNDYDLSIMDDIAQIPKNAVYGLKTAFIIGRRADKMNFKWFGMAIILGFRFFY